MVNVNYMCSWGEHSSYFFSRISSLRQSRTLESNVIAHLGASHFFYKNLRFFFLFMIWWGVYQFFAYFCGHQCKKKCSVDEFKNKILKFWLFRHRDILTDVTITCEDKQFKETDAIILMIFNCFIVFLILGQESYIGGKNYTFCGFLNFRDLYCI